MKSLEKGEILNFGKRQNGFIFALMKRIRLDTFEDDFGVSVHMIESSQNQDFLMIDPQNHLLESTRRLYNILFERFYGRARFDPSKPPRTPSLFCTTGSER